MDSKSYPHSTHIYTYHSILTIIRNYFLLRMKNEIFFLHMSLRAQRSNPLRVLKNDGAY